MTMRALKWCGKVALSSAYLVLASPFMLIGCVAWCAAFLAGFLGAFADSGTDVLGRAIVRFGKWSAIIDTEGK